MGYGSAAEDERMLSYASPKEATTGATGSQTQALPTTMGNGAPAAPPPGISTEHNSSALGMSVTGDRALSYLRQTWQECRPWQEFYSTRDLSVPPFASLSDRAASNLHVYRANYQVISIFWVALTMLTAIPHFLVALVLLFALERWLGRRARLNNNSLQLKDKVIAGAFALGIIGLTHTGQLVVGSLLFTFVTVAGHATFHEPDHIETEIATV